jgi:hypothetical protein
MSVLKAEGTMKRLMFDVDRSFYCYIVRVVRRLHVADPVVDAKFFGIGKDDRSACVFEIVKIYLWMKIQSRAQESPTFRLYMSICKASSRRLRNIGI